MQLPSELLILAFLTGRACAWPQQQTSLLETPFANATSPSISIETLPTSYTVSIITATVHLESTQPGFEVSTPSTKTPGTTTAILFSALPTATDFGDDPPIYSAQLPQTRSNNEVVTIVPSLIGIETNIATGGAQKPSKDIGEPPQPTPGSLLSNIISQIARPGSQPTQGASATASNPQQFEQAPGTTVAASEFHPTLVAGGLITLNAATLTLTPGLATMLGTGDAATFIAIKTNASGKTVIVISSSGTATTATMNYVLSTTTVPGTEFDGSVTATRRPASNTAPASTSSRGGAAERYSGGEWWTHVLFGAVGLGVVL